MTQSEAIEKIISEPKFYIGKINQSTASNFVASFRMNMAKQKTIDRFLEKFGYVKVQDAQYEQQQYIDPNFEKKFTPTVGDVSNQIEKHPLDKYEIGGTFHGEHKEIIVNKTK